MSVKSSIVVVVVTIVALAIVRNVSADDVDCTKPPPPLEPFSCCQIPEVIDEDIHGKCKEFDMSLPPPPKPNGPHPPPKPRHSPCYIECMYNETNMFNDDNTLNEDSLSTHLNSKFSDHTELIPIVTEAYKSCVVKLPEIQAKIQEMLKNAPPPPPPPNGDGPHRQCGFRPAMLMGCVLHETFRKCPTNIWNDNTQCNAWRDFSINCIPSKKN